MLRPLFGMNFCEEFSDFSTLEYDIPNLCIKSVKSIALVAIIIPTLQEFKIVKKDQSMSLAMLQGYLKEGDNYQTLDVKTLRYCKIIW